MISLVRCTIQTVKDAVSRSSEAASSTCKRAVKHGIRCFFFFMFVFHGLAQSLYRCYNIVTVIEQTGNGKEVPYLFVADGTLTATNVVLSRTTK